MSDMKPAPGTTSAAATVCPRPCSECADRQHHWIYTMDEDNEEGPGIVVCRHCSEPHPDPENFDPDGLDDLPMGVPFNDELVGVEVESSDGPMSIEMPASQVESWKDMARYNTQVLRALGILPDEPERPTASNPAGDVCPTCKGKRMLTYDAIERCHSQRDGECVDARCPQLRDNEPHATGRHCPLDTWADTDGDEEQPCPDCKGTGKIAEPILVLGDGVTYNKERGAVEVWGGGGEAQYECVDCQHPLGEHDGDGECWHPTHENTCPCDRGPVKPVEPSPPPPPYPCDHARRSCEEIGCPGPESAPPPRLAATGRPQCGSARLPVTVCPDCERELPPVIATPEQGDAPFDKDRLIQSMKLAHLARRMREYTQQVETTTDVKFYVGQFTDELEALLTTAGYEAGRTPEQGNADAAEAAHHWIAELAVVWSDWGIFAQCRREEGEENEADIYEQCRETIRAICQKHAAFDEAARTSGEKPLTDEERQWLQTYREKKAQGFGPSWINLTPVERPSFSIDEDGDL